MGFALVGVCVAAGSALGQPPGPLDLVRGLRDNGHVDFALEYLQQLENKPLTADDKAALGLERAKCLLAACEDEPDEGTRLGMVAEAKAALQEFLVKFPNHPRRAEGLLTEAKLLAVDAREQLNQARRMDIPPKSNDPGENTQREALLAKQKAEALKAQPLFLTAAKRFEEASKLLRAKLSDPTLEPATRARLEQEAFDAELAVGINQFNTAETYVPEELLSGVDKAARDKLLEQAKTTFAALAKGSPRSRTVWIARAWIAEVLYEQGKANDAAAEVKAIIDSREPASADGKRMARFFQLRRNFLEALRTRTVKAFEDSEREIRNWLRTYGNPRKPSPEEFAAKYYLARIFQTLAEDTISRTINPKDPKPPKDIPTTARRMLEEAEKLYRELSHTDHEYTSRATRQRINVVVRMLGEAEKPPESYDSFEKAQLASLIQLSKLAKAEALPETTEDEINKKAAEINDRRRKVIALLERARALATPQDNAADVTDVLLRLIYFYQLVNDHLKAAELGEQVAQTIKSTGGKAAVAGLFAITSYIAASRMVPADDPDEAAQKRQELRQRAIQVAQFLDEKFPNDTATDAARHQHASILLEEKRLPEAFQVLLKVRPAYAQIAKVRLLQGYIARELMVARNTALSDEDKAAVFRRALSELGKIPRPPAAAGVDDVRDYVSAQCRIGSLLFLQGRADPATEKTRPGYNQALQIAEEMLKIIPTYDCLTKLDGGKKALNLDGLELTLLAQDVQARAIYLKARAMIDEADTLAGAEQAAKLNEVTKVLQPILQAVSQNGALYTAEMKQWSQGVGGDEDDIQKARIAQLAATVDKTRVDVILAAFRLKVRQAQAAEAASLLDVMVKAGGNIEDNLPVLELLGREMAAQMRTLRNEGKTEEAKVFGAGLAELLKKITTVPNLEPRVVLFLGETLQVVGENDRAIEMLRKIRAPEFAGWETKRPEEIPAELRGRIQEQIRDYALAQLTIARAFKEKRDFDAAEKMLTEIIGTNDKPNWGYGRFYFRRELASVYETKAQTLTDAKAAKAEWDKAYREWLTICNFQRNRLIKPPAEASAEQMRQYRNAYADAFLDLQRCVVKANQQLLKAAPEKLKKTYEDVGKQVAVMERQLPIAEWYPDVHRNYMMFLKETPEVVGPYKANGGKLFLEPLPENP
ncbi:MAG: hypothetical protein RMJ56_12515 [Gemmataceae bacterium]|nr:hypothetical protein [Gemmata sp.]MDW8198416.1 hypothetical protein [Gemmataceae bacterium]